MSVHFCKASASAAAMLVLAITGSQAATELEKFTQTMPASVRLPLAEFNSCGLINGILKDGGAARTQHIPIANVKQSILEACSAYLKSADDELKLAGMPDQVQRQETLEKYLSFYFSEQNLLLQGKPIPGQVQDPWVTQTLSCGKATEVFVTNYRICVEAAIREIAPFSDDPSDVVADAAIGRCEPLKADYIVKTIPCVGASAARANASNAAADFRSKALGQIAAFRAQLKKLQQTPPPASTPAVRSPTENNI